MSTDLSKGELKSNGTVLTPEFRVSFAWVFKPQKSDDPTKAPKYSVTMLFPKNADLSHLKKAAMDVMIDKFGPDKSKWPTVRSPFRDQKDKADKFKGYEPGNTFITATSKDQPGLVDAMVQKIINPSEFYSGCYAVATVNAFYYENKGNKGVSFGLRNIQKTRDGEPLGNRSNPETDFAPVGGGESAPSGTAGASDIFG